MAGEVQDKGADTRANARADSGAGTRAHKRMEKKRKVMGYGSEEGLISPIGNPMLTTRVMPTTLVMSVWKRNSPGTRSPFRYALSCGSPEAAAIGVYLRARGVRARIWSKGKLSDQIRGSEFRGRVSSSCENTVWRVQVRPL